MDVDNLLDKCRSCLGNEENMISLYQENHSEIIYKKLIAFASITICESDGGPTKICDACLKHLNDALKFKSICEHADKKIHSLLNNSINKINGDNFKVDNTCSPSKNIKDENSPASDNDFLGSDGFLEFDNKYLPSEDIKTETTFNETSKKLSSNKNKVKNKLVKKLKIGLKRKKERDDILENNLVVVKRRGRPPKIAQSDNSNCANQQLNCNVCNKIFKSVKTHEKHILSHNQKREYTCDECGKQFKYRDNLKAHALTHSGEKPFKCDMCTKTFSKKDNLQIHIRRHLKLREWSCEICGSSYYTSYELKTHTRTHTGEKPHVCTLCGKRFTAKNNLYIHLRTHTGEKPHVCTVCGKKFTSKNILTIHSRTHTGEKPYICSVCGKRFTANKLAAHMRTHTGEKPHVCSLCGKQFSAANVLMIHMRRHTGEKPYECKICGQNYGHTQSLNKHMRKQHKIITNITQLKMKQINEAHQAYLKSKESKDTELQLSQTHQTIMPKPTIIHTIPNIVQENVLNSETGEVL